jgi:adenylate cyclase
VTPPIGGQGATADSSSALPAAIPQTPPSAEPPLSSLWQRIKKHKLVEWAVAYIAFGYATLHGVGMLREAFDWPGIVPRLTVFVLLLGFPVAVTLAWYHGHRARQRVSGPEFAILAVLLVLAGSVFWFFSTIGARPRNVVSASVTPAVQSPAPGPAAFSPPPHSVAVLPFTNLSGDPRQEYFSDGMSEELINALTQIDSLRVIARTSSFSFKGQNVDIETIGRKLNTAAILEGSIRRVGNTVRITAQLINARNGFHIWSQDYDRDLTNVLALQSEIATVVAQQLQARLLGDEAAKIEAGGTHEPAAYDAVLRGNHILANAANEQDYRKAIEAADEAIAADPKYADAYTLRARALALHCDLYPCSIQGRNEEFSQALESGRHAVMLDPSQGEAHAFIADSMMHKMQYSGAVSEFNRALSLSPGNAAVQDEYGYFQIYLGHLADSLTAERRAIELDPENSLYRHDLALALLWGARRPSEALVPLRDAAVLNPDSQMIGQGTWQIYLLERHFDLMAQYCEKADSPLQEYMRHLCLADAYHGLGKGKQAQEQLEKVKAMYGDLNAFEYACVYAQFGETRNAMDWLLKAEKLRDPELMMIKARSELDPIRDEPAFKALVRRLNFPP